MHAGRDDIVHALRERGDHDRALEAACGLPRDVDTDRDRGMLKKVGVNPDTLLGIPAITPDTPDPRV
jgi:hypothetical protein